MQKFYLPLRGKWYATISIRKPMQHAQNEITIDRHATKFSDRREPHKG